jgi:hypothetical protein
VRRARARNPRWDEAQADSKGDWRSYATDEIKDIWESFTVEQRMVIVALLDDIARRVRESPSYTCPRCGAMSYNPNDLGERYGGGAMLSRSYD